MLVKAIIIVFLATILVSLGSALYFMLTDRGDSRRTARALTWRIGLSLGLFLLLMLAFATGLIQPHGGPTLPH
jgi:hypothetical protein